MAVEDWSNAPFTDEQIKNLNDYQFSGIFHPFTCPKQHFSITRNRDLPPDAPLSDFEVRHLSEDEINELEREHGFIIWEDHVLLVAFEEGWRCPTQTCEYTQGWAWQWMADGLWRDMKTLGMS